MGTDLAALIFDVDGTLAETEEAHRLAFNAAFAEFGLPWSWPRPLYRQLLQVSGGKERIRAFVAQADPVRLDAAFPALVAALHARKTALYTAGVAAGGLPLRPGVAELIGEARAAGLRLAVATTTTRANVLALLDGATQGAGHGWFAVMACAEEAPAKKPDPAVYHRAVQALGMEPGRCVAFEDSANGVRAACAAGVPVIAVRSAFTDGDDVGAARAVFSEFTELDLRRLRCLHAGAAT